MSAKIFQFILQIQVAPVLNTCHLLFPAMLLNIEEPHVFLHYYETHRAIQAQIVPTIKTEHQSFVKSLLTTSGCES